MSDDQTPSSELLPVEESLAGEQPASTESRSFGLSGGARLYISAALLSLWLLFLFVGATLGGAVHLALVAVLALRPWRLPA